MRNHRRWEREENCADKRNWLAYWWNKESEEGWGWWWWVGSSCDFISARVLQHRCVRHRVFRSVLQWHHLRNWLYLLSLLGITSHVMLCVILHQQFHCVVVISFTGHPVLESASSFIGFPSSQHHQQEVPGYLPSDNQHTPLIVLSRALSQTSSFGPPRLTLMFSKPCIFTSVLLCFLPRTRVWFGYRPHKPLSKIKVLRKLRNVYCTNKCIYSKTCLKRNAIVPVFFFRFHRFPFYKGLCFNKTKYKKYDRLGSQWRNNLK